MFGIPQNGGNGNKYHLFIHNNNNNVYIFDTVECTEENKYHLFIDNNNVYIFDTAGCAGENKCHLVIYNNNEYFFGCAEENKRHLVICNNNVYTFDTAGYTEENMKDQQSAICYAKKTNQIQDIINQMRNKSGILPEDMREQYVKQKEECLNNIKNKIDDKLSKMCIKCGLDGMQEIKRRYSSILDSSSIWEGLSTFTLRKLSTILAIFGDNPLGCRHVLLSDRSIGAEYWLNIFMMMEYVHMIDTMLYNGEEIDQVNKGFEAPFCSEDMIYRADRISRRDPTAIRFKFISSKISHEIIKGNPYFSKLRGEVSDIDEAVNDIYKNTEDNCFFTKENPSWPIVKKLAINKDKILDAKDNPIKLEDILERDDVYFNLESMQFINKSEDAVVVADMHGFIYGMYKTVLAQIETPQGEEGTPFEETAQLIFNLLLDKCNVSSGKTFVSSSNQSKVEVDLVAEEDNVLIIAECKDKGRYYNPKAGVEHIKNDVIGSGESQIIKSRKTLLDKGGIVRMESGLSFSNYKKDVNYIIPLVIHSLEYVFPSYEMLDAEEFAGDQYGVHHFSLEGLYIALFTCGDVDNLLNYLKFRKKYIDFHKSQLFGTIFIDELDICTSFIGGGGELCSLGGVYRLVCCADSYGWHVNDLSREEWLKFLKDMYEAKDPGPNSPYWDSLVRTMENNFCSIYEEYFDSNKSPDGQLNGYGKKIISHINSMNSIVSNLEWDELKSKGVLYRFLALSYLSFYI